jgi:hypothetical protein
MKRILFSLIAFFALTSVASAAAPHIDVVSPTQGAHIHAADLSFEVAVHDADEIPVVSYQIDGVAPTNCDTPLGKAMEYSSLNKTSFADSSYTLTSGSYDMYVCVVVDGFVYLPIMRSFTVQNLQFQSLNITADDQMFVQFTTPVDESTLAGNVILAKDSEVISLEISKVSDTLYKLSPKYALNRSMHYNFVIRTNVRDLNGHRFDQSPMSGYQEFQMVKFGA